MKKHFHRRKLEKLQKKEEKYKKALYFLLNVVCCVGRVEVRVEI